MPSDLYTAMPFRIASLIIRSYLKPTILASEESLESLELVYLLNIWAGWTIIGWMLVYGWVFMRTVYQAGEELSVPE